MSKKKRFGVSEALSRGLSETINVVENNLGTYRNTILPLSRIELDPDNPRKLAINLADVRQGLAKEDPLLERKLVELERLKELAATIASSGVINPIVAYKRGEHYRIVAGERRCLGSILAGKHEIEARIFNEKPKGFELKLVQWIENTAREDLTLDERIGNMQDIITEYLAQHQVTEMKATILKNITGLSLPQATYYLLVLNAPSDVKQAIAAGQVRSLDKAAVLAGIASADLRSEALATCIAGASLKELRNMITRDKQAGKNKKPQPAVAKRGRVSTRVQMGFTTQTKVVKAIVNAVLYQEGYQKYATIFSKIDWQHFDQVTRAFKQLIEILEHDTVV